MALTGSAAEPAGALRWLGLPHDRVGLRRRAVRDGLVLTGWLTSAWILVVIPAVGRSLGYDAWSYWFSDLETRYTLAEAGPYELGAFRYAPPIGLIVAPLGALPWWIYLSGWTALALGCLAWLGRARTMLLLAVPVIALELYHGNIHLLMAAAIVLGFRHPAAWSLVLLSKVTPGVALLWFAARREWRALAVAVGATAAVAAVSALLVPHLWTAWLATLVSSAGTPAEFSLPPPLPVRLAASAALVWWGARTDRPWTVGVAATLSLPHLWPHGLAMAVAAVPFLSRGRIHDPGDLVGRALGGARGLATAGVGAVAAALVLAVLLSPVLEPLITWASAALLAREP
jgi:hypothetical protein